MASSCEESAMMGNTMSAGDTCLSISVASISSVAGHNLVLNQFVGIVVNIIPHDELVEREDAQNRLLFHVPFTLVLNAVADNGIDQLDVYAAFVGRQRVQS